MRCSPSWARGRATLLSRVSRAALDDARLSRSAPCREIDDRLRDGLGGAAQPMSASSAGSCMCRPSSRPPSTTRCIAAGGDLGLRDAGYYAIESLRIEKGYRAWGRELTPDVDALQAGLGFAVKLDKGDFIGRDALVAAQGRAAAQAPRLARRPAPGDADGLGRRADHSPTASRSARSPPPPTARRSAGIVGLGWVHRTRARSTRPGSIGAASSLDVAGESVPVRASLRPFYDPGGERLRRILGCVAASRSLHEPLPRPWIRSSSPRCSPPPPCMPAGTRCSRSGSSRSWP